MEKLNTGNIQKFLDWTYDKAVNGVGNLDTAQKMGEDYSRGKGSLHDKVNRLIKWQTAKAATSGFITGIGGVFTLPIAIPANIASVIYVQVRMIAAIAYMGGYDIHDDRVKTLVYMCMTGSASADISKSVGIQFGKKFTKEAIKNISGKVITKINQRVGFRFITKMGEKGIINMTKLVPLLGGLIGGTFDAVATKLIGNIARNTFIDDE